MQEEPVTTWPFALVYLGALLLTVAVLHCLRQGLILAILAGLALAGMVATMLVLLATHRCPRTAEE